LYFSHNEQLEWLYLGLFMIANFDGVDERRVDASMAVVAVSA
jgi:hypothetical protein